MTPMQQSGCRLTRYHIIIVQHSSVKSNRCFVNCQCWWNVSHNIMKEIESPNSLEQCYRCIMDSQSDSMSCVGEDLADRNISYDLLYYQNGVEKILRIHHIQC